MPKLLFSKIRIYEIRDLMQNVRRPRRVDIVLNRKRRTEDVQGLTVQKTNRNDTSSQLSVQTDRELHPTLEKLLRDKKYLAAFHAFLCSEFSEENIEFWLACEDFRSTATPDNLRRRAEAIYEEFIQPAARREVNVDHRVRGRIERALGEPGRSCFDEAQRHVYLLMERDSRPRFLHSDAYLSLRSKSRTLWYM